MSNPVYVHDCTLCRYHGTVILPRDPRVPNLVLVYDVYTCLKENEIEPTINLRYSNQPAEYDSYRLSYAVTVLQTNINKPLREAFKLIFSNH